MDIEELKKKSQKNVQEQNAIKKDKIYNEAFYWKNNRVPKILVDILEKKGVKTESCIFLNYEQDFPGTSTDEGIVLTIDGLFFEFEMDLNKDRTKLVKLYLWKDITANTELKKSKKGTGSTWGWLALEVLNEINNNG